MAAPANSTDFPIWHLAVENLAVAQTAYAAVEGTPPCPARIEIERTIRTAKERLYSTPAPDLNAVTTKLATLWNEEELWGTDLMCPHRRRILGDLKRLQLTLAGIPEHEASGRSFEQVADNNAKWITTLREHAQYEQLLMEGSSEAWTTSSASDLVDLIDGAADELLSLAAPSLEAVARKLQILWEDELYDPLYSFACNAIIGDLRQLAHLAVHSAT